jgi:hypothetical protein
MPRVWLGVAAALLVPLSVWAQSNTPTPASEPATPSAGQPANLPTIHVPVPKQKAKRTEQQKRPPAKRAAAVRRPARATPAVTPAVPAVASSEGDADDTIGVSPVPGSGIARDKVPSNAQVLGPSSFDHARSPDFLDAIGQFLPGVSISDQNGNQCQRDV